jgi:hypothetical protein
MEVLVMSLTIEKIPKTFTAYLILQKWIDSNNEEKLKFGIYGESAISFCNGPEIKQYSQTILSSYTSNVSFYDANNKLYSRY